MILKQPNGLFAVWDSTVDGITLYDATAEELADYYADRAAESARIDTARRVAEADAHGHSGPANFAMTYDEAVTKHEARYGSVT
jgi:hypothetical protein